MRKKLSEKELFALGIAYGSFSEDAIDQGIHMVLPATDETSGAENEIFKTLFTDYFDKIPGSALFEATPNARIGEAYMGAIQAFIRDEQLDLFSAPTICWIEIYEASIKETT